MKKVAISQSNYIPWKGYFDLIAQVDVFILYDDMQYTRRDWRNRNKIKTPSGLRWLSLPVEVKGKYNQKISATKVANNTWTNSHWNQLFENYRSAPYFEEISSWLKPLYTDFQFQLLCDWNRLFINSICEYLTINTKILDSREFKLIDGKSQRLANLCSQVKANEYVTGPGARDYLDEYEFTERGVSVTWMDYSGYAEYKQLNGAFEHSVTILDLLFNAGPRAVDYMKFVK